MVLANPDFVARLKAGVPMNEPDRATFFGETARGYTDYPALELATPVQCARRCRSSLELRGIGEIACRHVRAAHSKVFASAPWLTRCSPRME
jgi:hypothetical protein